MYVLTGVLGLLMAYLVTALIYKKNEAGKVILLGTSLFISFYCIASGLLIWIDKFSILRGECFTLLLEACIAGVLFFTGRRIYYIKLKLFKYIPIIIVLIAATIISSMNKAGLHDSTQDEGTYAQKALLYIGGCNSNVLKFDEYENLLDDNEKIVYFSRLSDMRVSYYPILDEDAKEGDFPGFEIHGIYTFAALLALWGKIFGITNMTGVLTLCYVLSIGLTWIICDNFKLDKYLSVMISALTAVCPIILWCSKNILSEIVLIMFIAGFLAFITDNYKKKVYNWSVIFVIACSYFHGSVTMMLPMFLFIYVYLYLFAGKKKAIFSIILTSIGYITGLRMMYASSEVYIDKNLAELFKKTHNIINSNNFVKFMIVCLGLFNIVIIAFEYFGVSSKIRKKIKLSKKKMKNAGKFKILMIVLIAAMLVVFMILGIKTSKNPELLVSRLTVLTYVFMTGYVILPIALIGMVLNSAKIYKEPSRFIVMFIMVYAIVIYAAVWRQDIYFYYYYARYFSLFMIPIFIMAALILNYFRPIYVVPIILVAGVLLVTNNSLIYKEKDKTYADFTMINSISSCVDNQDAVVMMDDDFSIYKMFMIPVKAITGADMYFLDADYEKQMAYLDEKYEDVFVLGYDEGFAEREGDMWKNVYTGKLHYSGYDEHCDTTWPKEVIKYDSPIGLYIKQK